MIEHSFYKTFSSEEVLNFGRLINDLNPIHVDLTAAKSLGFEERIVHGAYILSEVSSFLANKYPGAGTVIASIEAKFIKPVLCNRSINFAFRTTDEQKEKKKLIILCEVLFNNDLLCKINLDLRVFNEDFWTKR